MSTPNGPTAPPARRGTGRPATRGRALRGVSASRSSPAADNSTQNAKQGLARAGLFGGRGGRGRRGHGDSHTAQTNTQAFQGSKSDGNKSFASPFRGLDKKNVGPGRTLKNGQSTSNRLNPGVGRGRGAVQRNGVLPSKSPQFGTPSPSPFDGNGNGGSIDRSRDPRRRNTSSPFPRKASSVAPDDYNGRYEQLKLDRANRRTEAIKAGQMADPNQPISLNRAITPTGTCTDMCPEYERVERIVQKMVDKSEKFVDPESGVQTTTEAMMIKRFRRSAAGYDEQLPSDIRTPKTLLQTLNYMLRHVLQDDNSLGSVHKFVWDRTRSIRNDLSIQQLTQEDDVKVAVKCLERIARFHIVSLHLLSSPDNSEPFDHHQDREQLNNTFLSLLYYYDDNRGRIHFPNEDEFRAYYIVYSIRDQRPDLESRVQKWPHELREAPRVRVALELFAAATNTWEYQGALDARRPNAIAQGFYARFFHIIKSDSVSYLMGCIAEIYFNHIRQTAIRSIWKAYCRHPLSQQSKNQEWTVDELTSTLAFDDNDQTIAFCEEQNLQLATNTAGEIYLNWGERSLDSVAFSPSTQQTYSATYVETKRCGRNLAALILGMTASQAARHKMIDESLLQNDYESQGAPVMEDQEAEEPLFVNDDEAKQRNGTVLDIPRPNLNSNVPTPSSTFSFSQPPGGQPLFGQASTTNVGGNVPNNSNAPNPFAFESPFKFSATAPAFTPQSHPPAESGQQSQGFFAPSPFPPQSSAPAPGPSQLAPTNPSTSSTPATFSSTFGSGFDGKLSAQSNDQKAPAPPKAPLFGPADSSASVKSGALDTTDKVTATPSPFQQLHNVSTPISTSSGPLANSTPPKPSFSFSKPEEKLFGLSSGFGRTSFGDSFKPSSSSQLGRQPSVFDQGASSPFKPGLFSQPATKESAPSFGQPTVAKPSFTFDTAASQSAEDQPKDKVAFGAPSNSTTSFSTFPSSTPKKDSSVSASASELTEKENKKEDEQKAAEAKKKADETAKQVALEKETAQREALEKQAAAKEAERFEAERKEALAREAAKREAERQESERKEALAREAVKKKMEEKRAAEQAAARAKMEAEELKAANADIAKIQAAEKKAQRRELEKREAILQDMAKRKAALYEDGDGSAERYKPRRKSEEDILAVEELLRLDRIKPKSPPRRPPSSTESLINEDELLFSAARMAANNLASGKRLFSDVPDFSDSYSASPSPHTDRFRRSTPGSSTSRFKGKAPVSHVSVNGYDVALAPETPLGLGRTLSRTEQRIRQTGARGLASIPLPSLGKASSTKSRKAKRVKRDESSV